MIIYLFKGMKGDILLMNELSAHNEIRNKGQWQRQDLIYLGACDDAPLKEVQKNLKKNSIEKVLSELPSVKLLEKEIKLMELNKEDVTRKKLELEVLKGRLEAQIRDRSGFVSNEIDSLQAQVMECENETFNSAISKLEPNPKIIPRNFNSVTSGFNGENVSPAGDAISGFLV